MNEIVFPAAILQPPFFDMNADDAVNYGAIGAVIGHEIGHGFDDQGSKSDGDGNMINWWTDADRKEFEARTKMLIDQYSELRAGAASRPEGQRRAHDRREHRRPGRAVDRLQGYRRSLKGQEAPVIDGLTGDQRFFIGWALAWRSKYRDAELARRLATDPHSPAEFRCNGVLRNLPEFYAAFGVKEGDKLWLPARAPRADLVNRIPAPDPSAPVSRIRLPVPSPSSHPFSRSGNRSDDSIPILISSRRAFLGTLTLGAAAFTTRGVFADELQTHSGPDRGAVLSQQAPARYG